MRNAARKQGIEHEEYDVALTLVPTELDEAVPFVPRARAPKTPVLVEVPAPAPTPAPAPARSRTGLLVAGAVGGGVVLGGGVVGLLAAVLGGVTALAGVAGVAAWWLTSAPVVVEPAPVDAIEVPAEPPVDAPVDEVPVVTEPEAPPAPAAAPAGATTRRPASAPAAPPTAPTAPAAPAAPAAVEVPDELVAVKLITDPPAAALWVDGEPKGRTPAKLLLTPGAHTVRLESGKASGSFPITVGAGGERLCWSVDGKKVDATTCP
jgi:hypothetical protein